MPIGCGQAFCASQQESLDFHSGAISFQGWTFSHFICSHRIAKLFIASLHPIVTAFRLKQAVQGGEQQDPSENHAVNATSYSIGRSILQSCSACGPTSKGDAKGERKNEPKEELEAKTWPIKSSEEDEVMECEEQPSHQLVGAITGQPPWGPGTGTRPVQSLTIVPRVGATKKNSVEQLHFSHASISMNFQNGRWTSLWVARLRWSTLRPW